MGVIVSFPNEDWLVGHSRIIQVPSRNIKNLSLLNVERRGIVVDYAVD